MIGSTLNLHNCALGEVCGLAGEYSPSSIAGSVLLRMAVASVWLTAWHPVLAGLQSTTTAQECILGCTIPAQRGWQGGSNKAAAQHIRCRCSAGACTSSLLAGSLLCRRYWGCAAAHLGLHQSLGLHAAEEELGACMHGIIALLNLHCRFARFAMLLRRRHSHSSLCLRLPGLSRRCKLGALWGRPA